MQPRFRLITVATVSGLALLAGLLVAPLSAGRTVRPKVDHVKWRLVSRSAYQMVASGHFVLVNDGGVPLRTDSLIDTRTTRRIAVPAPAGCSFGYGLEVISDRWLGRLCSLSADIYLYSLPGGGWRDFGVPAGVKNEAAACAMTYQCAVQLDGVGSHWIAWSFQCVGNHCDPADFPAGFTNVQFGKWRKAPTSPSMIANLNSAVLTHKLCSPLRQQPGYSLALFGKFAVSEKTYTDAAYLERCGSHLHKRLADNFVTGDQTELIGRSGAGLSAVFLPGQQRVTIPLPKLLQIGGTKFALSSGKVYADTDSGELWTAPAPSPPKTPHRAS